MIIDFPNIPRQVREHVRDVFAQANDIVSKEMTEQPYTSEPNLDSDLIRQVSNRVPVYFPAEQVAVRIETHSLASRRLHDGLEIADLAIVVTLRQGGTALKQKVGLIQTKRLVARHMKSGAPPPTNFGLTRFRYDGNCSYEALRSGSDQSAAIAAYAKAKLPVFYGLYNPLEVPYEGEVPKKFGAYLPTKNTIGMRVIPANDVHKVLAKIPNGQGPTFAHLTASKPYYSPEPESRHGWRLERFVADELLPCRQGGLLNEKDPKLVDVIFARDRPLFSVLELKLDFGEQGAD